MKTKLSIWLFAAMFGLAACSQVDNPADNGGGVTPPPHNWTPDYASVICTTPVFVSGSINPIVRTPLESFLTDITTLDEAEIAIVAPEDIGSYDGKLIDIYNRDGLIVIVHPTADELSAFCEKYGIFNAMPSEPEPKEILLFAFNKKGLGYTLYAQGPDTDEDSFEYYKRRIYRFFDYAKNRMNSQNAARTRATQYVTPFSPAVAIVNSQSIVNDYEYTVSQSPIGWFHSMKETGSFEIAYYVYPVYVFECAGESAGDYYIVKGGVTVHNGQTWNPYFQMGDGMIAAFYMKKLKVGAMLGYVSVDDRGNKYADFVKGAYFATSPKPVSTTHKSSYSAGVELGINGALSAGTDAGSMSFGFSATHNSSTTHELDDIELTMNTDNTYRLVSYDYYVNTDFKTWPTTAKQRYDALSTEVPLPACSDFVHDAGWTWLIPVGWKMFDGEVKDGWTGNFQMKNSVVLNLAYYDFPEILTAKPFADSKKNNWEYIKGDISASFLTPLRAPTRSPFGIIALQNLHDTSIGYIRIWLQDDKAGTGDPYVEMDTGCRQNGTAKVALPVGTYYLEYQQMDGGNNPVGTWMFKDIVVHSGSTEEAATTNITTQKATKISD